MNKAESIARSKLLPGDAIVADTHGLRSRKGRTLLTAIGIAAMVAVLGISSSSKADLLAEIDDLGTNLLQVKAGTDSFGEGAKLAEDSSSMVRRVGPVNAASSVSSLGTEVQRSALTDDANSLDVLATEPDLLNTLEGTVSTGR
ncbi:MAG: putative ABC transport system permease protein [Candidatus Poriferisodalaceae bacterium]|jgi:putative ABC transport system permease protein